MHQPRTEATGPVAAWVAPVAVRFTHDCVLLDARARNAARLLDDRALDVDCALVQAAAVGAAVLDDDPLQAAMAVAQSRELRRRLPRVAPGSGVDHEPLAHSTAEAVARGVVASASGDSFAAAIEQALEDGDAGPTLGALTGASAGARFGASGIPARWINALEDAPDGSRHISALADELQRRAHAAPSRMYRVPRRHRSSA